MVEAVNVAVPSYCTIRPHIGCGVAGERGKLDGERTVVNGDSPAV